VYQGGELWDLGLVDPDNRRPPDFDRRAKALAGVRERLGRGEDAALAAELLHSWPDGAVKLLVLHRLLHLRARLPDVFERGSYRRLEVRGAKAEHVVAFTRRSGRRAVVVVVPRWPTRLAAHGRAPVGSHVWGDCELVVGAETSGRDTLTGAVVTAENRRLRVGDVLSVLPVAVLETAPSSS
jgi:maltooligosyltrehalose synthase